MRLVIRASTIALIIRSKVSGAKIKMHSLFATFFFCTISDECLKNRRFSVVSDPIHRLRKRF